MKSIIAFLITLHSISVCASQIISEAKITSKLTDKQASELGMTEIFQSKKKRNNILNDQQNISESGLGHDLNNDAINSTLAEVVVIVNESDRSKENPEGQTAKLYHHGKLLHSFNVSTGSRKVKITTSGRSYVAITPAGFWRPKKAYSAYYSYTFFGATMPYAIFYHGGIALHGTEAIIKLGTRDSGGCVRFNPEDIKIINDLMRATGDGNPSISKEVLCLESDPGQCITRKKYLDRTKLQNVDRLTGYETDEIIWTYDALIVVKKPFN